MIVFKIAVFVLGSLGIYMVSRSSLRSVNSHGFYRFFAWETILIMFLLNMDYWFANPFGPAQISSWILLFISLYLIFQGVGLFQRKGGVDQERSDPELLGFEKTAELVTSGLYHYIRHPFYSSLLFLAWGIFFKRATFVELLLGIITTVLLVMTAKREEIEDIKYFGDQYKEYMKRTKRFVPFVF